MSSQHGTVFDHRWGGLRTDVGFQVEGLGEEQGAVVGDGHEAAVEECVEVRRQEETDVDVEALGVGLALGVRLFIGRASGVGRPRGRRTARVGCGGPRAAGPALHSSRPCGGRWGL